MANTVLFDGYVSINAVDVSGYVKGFTLPQTISAEDATVMGTGRTVIHKPSLKGFTPAVEFLNDFTDNELDEDFYTLWNDVTEFAVVYRIVKNTVVGTGNPEYRFSAFIGSWNPLGEGRVGKLAGSTLQLINTTTLTRATA